MMQSKMLSAQIPSIGGVSMGVSAHGKGGHFYAARPRVVVVPSISYGV
ncbi:MAG: hypothetical protein ABI683_13485 [Ginsengibacter sp.]